MIETKSQLTTREIDDIYQSMSAAELWVLHKEVEPIEINRVAPEELVISQKIWAIMDQTDLDYESVEKILFNPKQATLGDIAIYCKTMKIDYQVFIGKVLN